MAQQMLALSNQKLPVQLLWFRVRQSDLQYRMPLLLSLQTFRVSGYRFSVTLLILQGKPHPVVAVFKTTGIASYAFCALCRGNIRSEKLVIQCETCVFQRFEDNMQDMC
jgi:hypothetical protein